MKPAIAFIHQAFPYSGAERVTIDVANGLVDRGYAVVVLTPEHCKERYPQGIDIRFRVVEMPPCRLKASKEAAHWLKEYLLANDISVIISYRELLYMPWLKQETGAKFVYVLHNMVGYEYAGGAKWLDPLNRLIYRSKYRRIYKQADAYGVLCPQYREEVLEMVGRKVCSALNDDTSLHAKDSSSSDGKLYVLPNPISISIPVEKVNMQKEKELLYVGRLSHRDKRVDRLLRIWSLIEGRLPGWRLTIVGSGKKEESLKQMARKLELQRITFEGQQSKVQPYYDRSAILCLTSSFEGWPMSIGEAQMNGVVPVVFDSFAGAFDMITHGVDGLIVPSFSEEAFGEELVELCTSGEKLRQMSLNAVEKSREYNIVRTCNSWEAMLSNIMQK